MVQEGRARRSLEKAVVVLDSLMITDGVGDTLGPLYYKFERSSLVQLGGIEERTVSTLLQTIAGLRQPLGGAVSLYGAVAHSDEGRSIVAYSSPSIRLLPGLTVVENAVLCGCCRANGERIDGLPDELADLLLPAELLQSTLAGELDPLKAARAAQVVLLASQARVICLDGSLENFDRDERLILARYLEARTDAGAVVLTSPAVGSALGLPIGVVAIAATTQPPVRKRRRR